MSNVVVMSGARPWWEPPLSGTDSEHLVAMLERLRATFRWKADGLAKDQLCIELPTSSLTMGGLLKHLAMAEDDVFAWRINGDRPVTRFLVPESDDVAAWQFRVGDDESANDVYRLWDDAVRRSRAAWSDIIETGSLDEPGALEFDGQYPSVRRHVCDLIEEYGRHTGHADLLREAIDGRTGEDPPADWTPVGPAPQ